MEDFAGLVAAFGLFGWIPIMVYFKHKIRLEELRSHRRGGDENTLHALQELRREVQDLRDTTTKFDMSFDAALSRLEGRMDTVEARTSLAAPSGDASIVQNRGRE